MESQILSSTAVKPDQLKRNATVEPYPGWHLASCKEPLKVISDLSFLAEYQGKLWRATLDVATGNINLEREECAESASVQTDDNYLWGV